jgi:membrane protease YdiL (CAAX protease family)
LLTIFTVVLVIPLTDKRFDKKRFQLRKYNGWNALFLRIAIFTVISLVSLYIINPQSLFDTPRKMPFVWLVVLISYPIWSAFPQELIFRAYFFHRYGKLFSNEKVLIFLNAILFAFAHIIFDNWLAILLTFIGSILFTFTYQKSKSLMVVFIEHAIYDNIIFTIGLGDFFYAP